MKRGIRIGLALLLAIVLAAVLALASLLASEAGSRWLLGWVPGLQVEGFEGRLGGRWQAQSLRWQQGEQQVQVDGPRFQWSPSCLLRLRLCIDELAADKVELVFPPSTEPASDEPFELPDIRLPVGIQLSRVDIGPVSLNGDELLRSAHLEADWLAQGVKIAALRVTREDLQAELTGTLRLDGTWPLDLTGQASLPAPDARPWQVTFALSGDVRENLALKLDSEGYLVAALNGSLQPLHEHLPGSFLVQVRDFKAAPELPETLRLDELELTARGDLQDGYAVLGTGRFPGQGGAVRLALEARATAQGAQVQVLELDAGEQQRLELKGDFDWAQGLKADASLHWNEFPWQRLYPLDEAPPVTLHRLTTQVQYDDGRYLGNLDANLSGPAGAFTLVSPFSGTLQEIHLPQLALVAGQGRVAGSLSAGFADAIDWKADLTLSDFDPAYWLAELPGKLAGTLKSQGGVQGGVLRADADLNLQGELRRRPARLALQANGAGEQWNVPQLQLQLGDNSVKGSGRWAERLAGQLDLDLRNLGQLWPGLAGQLSGALKLAGTATAPEGELNLGGQRLAFEDNKVGQLQLDAVLDAGERARLGLKADGIRVGENDLGQATLSASGTRQRHEAALALQGPLLKLALGLDGGLRGDAWHGQLERLDLDAQQQRWSLQAPATLSRLANGRIDLGAHCWVSGPASLCAEKQRLLPDTQVRYRLRDFQLASLEPYLPDDFAWQGVLSADIHLDLPSAGPSGRITLDAGPGLLRLREAQEWVDFPYQTLALDSQLTPRRVDGTLRFKGASLGELEVRVGIDPRSELKTLSGDFQLSGLDLSVARPFVEQIDRLEGKLNGSGRLSGSLMKPVVNGRLVLSDGEIAGNELPLSVEALQVTVLIDGERLQLDGGWRSGERGQGQLSGRLDWHEALDLELSVTGSDLPVAVEPYAELDVTPDLRITLLDQQLSISGKVAVPRGSITVRELPPSTVKVSQDAQIVGQDVEGEQAGMAMRMDIAVEVGQERLRFSGFGLTADLAGHLHIGNDLDARGELNLNNGRYRAYGQRLTIRRARLLFTGLLSQPYLDIEAIRRIDAENVVAGLRISGSAEQPRIDVFSEPTMSQEQALAYLVLGRALGADTGDSNLLAQAALGLGLMGGSSVAGGLAEQLGIEDFMLDTEGTGNSTSVVASGQITERLSLRYGVGVFEPANTIALRYRLTRRIFLEAASGLASSLDIFYRRDF
ncbi:translocation/assembly module TamB [Pseudomonas sp. ABC1]|uniref:translocation/assembly module TamB domain-containing protein n=1 Tax=Pseudomonas sp. ABC1 TaxID=2748080 RepID=UPI0015C2D057|nr:translocation/assembly module TamB domain-containing protein [Pseudomonas sp. ABC1]QLF91957.1 translocation/assembly module TamB [Pseudomonas sp. ABC1]